MDKQLMKKLTSVSFIGAALLTYAVVNMLFKSMAGAFGPVQRLYSIDWLNHGLPILAAASVFLIMQLNPKILTWAEEVLLEVSKIVWPSRRDTFAMTIVVCVFVGIACFLLLVIDFVSRNVIQMIIN
jgi:preprotein translocase subunit SecE